ncbi:uncharacterized protein [Triticum aestivum]|nr:uncharacterized protein LOC123166292 isoform X2 [Triticum aestivum]
MALNPPVFNAANTHYKQLNNASIADPAAVRKRKKLPTTHARTHAPRTTSRPILILLSDASARAGTPFLPRPRRSPPKWFAAPPPRRHPSSRAVAARRPLLPCLLPLAPTSWCAIGAIQIEHGANHPASSPTASAVSGLGFALVLTTPCVRLLRWDGRRRRHCGLAVRPARWGSVLFWLMRLSTDGLSSGDSSDATRLACVSGGGGVHLLPGAAVVAWDTAGSAAKMDFSGGAFENVDMSTNPRLCSSTSREGSRCRCSSTR